VGEGSKKGERTETRFAHMKRSLSSRSNMQGKGNHRRKEGNILARHKWGRFPPEITAPKFAMVYKYVQLFVEFVVRPLFGNIFGESKRTGEG